VGAAVVAMRTVPVPVAAMDEEEEEVEEEYME